MNKNKRIINNGKHSISMKTSIKLCLILVSLTLFISLVSSVEIEPIKQGENALLYQTCNNCTFCNITNIINPNNVSILSNTEFDQDGTYYSKVLLGGNTTTLGKYSYFYYCGNADETEAGKIDFNVTPSGRDGNNNIVLVIILVLIIYVVTFLCFFGRNVPLSILSGMFMTFFGIWIIQNGIVIYRDNLTNYFGYVTIAIGSIIALWAVVEWIEEIF